MIGTSVEDVMASFKHISMVNLTDVFRPFAVAWIKPYNLVGLFLLTARF